MSASYRIALLKEKRRKKAFQSLNTEHEDVAFPLSLDMDTLTYTNTFNTYLTKLKRSEYQSKNPDLFCWNQTPRYMNKLIVPPHLMQTPSRQSLSSRNLPDSPGHETGSEDVSSVKKPSTVFNKTSSTRSLKKEVPTKLEKAVGSQMIPNKPRKQKKTLDLDLAEFESLTKLSPFHTKTTYPSSKIQTDLLTSRSDPASIGVNNHQFMLNHFDKRNYSINKIVSQIRADEELLNKDLIMRETLAKRKYVSRKPTRTKTQVGDPFLTINSARSYLPGQSDDMTSKLKSSMIESSEPITRQTTQKKRGSTLEPEIVSVYRQPSQKKLAVIDERLKTSELEGVPITRQVTQKRGEHRISTQESEPVIRQISQKRVFDLNLQNVLSNMDDDAKSVRTKKAKISFRTTEKAKRAAQSLKRRGSDLGNQAQEKNLIKDIKTGIQKLDEFSSQRDFVREGDRPPSAPEDDLNKPLKSFMQFVRTSSMTWKTKTPDEEAMLKVTKVRIKNDNIFNYKNYFKKKYMENGMNMEVSPELKSRIVSFEKDVKSSINRIKAMSANKNNTAIIDGKF